MEVLEAFDVDSFPQSERSNALISSPPSELPSFQKPRPPPRSSGLYIISQLIFVLEYHMDFGRLVSPVSFTF